jgi:hypothetical protein
MKIDSGFARVAFLNEVGTNFGFERAGSVSSQFSRYSQDGIDFPVNAADKKGGDGQKTKIEVDKGDTVQIKCADGSRPQIKPVKDGVDVTCPGGAGGGKKEGPPPKDGPSGSPIID